ncbi:MAG: glycosyltransferase family 4 protein [Lachnospira sp.]|nr:glycosyltransferase family 4 protein [Lachnospira sp.]
MVKVIVAHPHQQHSYKLAEALQENEMLFSYITTVYNKKGSLTQKVISLLKGELKQRAINRRNNNIDDSKVIQFGEFGGLFVLVLMRLVKNDKRIMNPVNKIIGNYFGKKVAKYAIKNDVDIVIGYDSECTKMFSYLKKKAPHIIRVMDVSAGNRLYLKEVYKKDFVTCPEFADRLKKEKNELFSFTARKEMDDLKKEIEDSDYFIVPSNFVKRSLYFSNVPESKMFYCNYGVELNAFSLKDYNDISYPIKFVYVGGIKQLKGVGYLLKAISNLPKDKAQLTIVGAYDDSKDLKPYLDRVKFTGHIIHSEVVKILKESDVFVFPSLGDSFSLACLEAAAVGLPLIVSENTGMIDNVKDGIEGFIIPIQNSDEIEQKMQWYIEHPHKIKDMGINARKMAMNYSWDKYKRNIVDIIQHIYDNKNCKGK